MQQELLERFPFFAGLDKEFTQTFRETLPFAQKQIVRFGDTWNETFKQLARVGRDPQFLAGLDDAFSATDGFFDKVNTQITLPAYIKDVAKVQIYCAWAEAVLGETTFDVTLTVN